jgi:hypothetical protein
MRKESLIQRVKRANQEGYAIIGLNIQGAKEYYEFVLVNCAGVKKDVDNQERLYKIIFNNSAAMLNCSPTPEWSGPCIPPTYDVTASAVSSLYRGQRLGRVLYCAMLGNLYKKGIGLTSDRSSTKAAAGNVWDSLKADGIINFRATPEPHGHTKFDFDGKGTPDDPFDDCVASEGAYDLGGSVQLTPQAYEALRDTLRVMFKRGTECRRYILRNYNSSEFNLAMLFWSMSSEIFSSAYATKISPTRPVNYQQFTKGYFQNKKVYSRRKQLSYFPLVMV